MSQWRDLMISLIVARRATGEQWAAGDLAVCIQDKWTEQEPASPKIDDVLRVSHVCGDGCWLHFEGKPDGLHWEVAAFRKVRPDTKPGDEAQWARTLQLFGRKVTT